MPLPIDTRVSIFGARWKIAFVPLTKNFPLMTSMTKENTSSYIAIPIGLPFSAPISQPNITPPIDTYIRGISRTADTARRIIERISGLTFSFFCDLSLKSAALYPAPETARSIFSAVAGSSKSTTI